MFYINFIFLTFILVSVSSSTLQEDKCHKELRELAQNQSSFTQCATVHSVPVKLCIGCKWPYNDMITSYNKLKENCTDKYFDNDRINIVSTTQSILAGLWGKAYCDDCFTTNNSIVFDEKKTELDSCLNNNKGNECIDCLVQYMDLNEFYTKLDQKNNGKVCYDMQDSMNRTRSHWSKDLGCCHRKFDKVLFVIVCSMVAALPFVFYGTTFALTKRQERNRDLFIVEDIQTNRVLRRANPNSSVADLPSTSSTATCPRVPSPKKKLDADKLTSSDDSDLDVSPTAPRKLKKNE